MKKDWDYSEDGVILDNRFYEIPASAYYMENNND